MRENKKYTLNGEEKLINQFELSEMAKKYLPSGMASEFKKEFVQEVMGRIAGLELGDVDTNGKSIEEYYFAACLAYAQENGYSWFFAEEDDLKIFNYCGAELEQIL